MKSDMAEIIERLTTMRDEHVWDYEPNADPDTWCAECSGDDIVPWPCPSRQIFEQARAALKAGQAYADAFRTGTNQERGAAERAFFAAYPGGES